MVHRRRILGVAMPAAGAALVRLSGAALLLAAFGGLAPVAWADTASAPGAKLTAPIEVFQLAFSRCAAHPANCLGSTHEITFDPANPTAFWITSPANDSIARVALDGSRTYVDLPVGTAPHGEEFDREGNLILGLEGTRQIAKLDPANGKILATWNINADPHGLALSDDGKTIWFTGKTANTVGKITPEGKVFNYPLPTANALPIYVRPGPDGNLWVTELTGNRIARVTPDGVISEFLIPTKDSRPIAIIPDPEGRGMWFSEEAGNKIGFITPAGQITEYPVPTPQDNMILAGLAFDRHGNLWVQQYLDVKRPTPDAVDAVIRIDRTILSKTPAQMQPDDFVRYATPTKASVLHRIVLGPDDKLWYTALKADVVGRVSPGDAMAPASP